MDKKIKHQMESGVMQANITLRPILEIPYTKIKPGTSNHSVGNDLGPVH